uniref:Uncharacterized protein n=1 Tax=Rhizophora mucronata TaxID=61149 RepID=A0A2P2MYW5_RHIMU
MTIKGTPQAPALLQANCKPHPFLLVPCNDQACTAT